MTKLTKREMHKKRLEILWQIDRLEKDRCEFCSSESWSSVNKSSCDCAASVEVIKLGNQLMKLVSKRKNEKVKIIPDFTGLTLENLTVRKYQELKEQEVSENAIIKGLAIGMRRLKKWKVEKGLI